MAQLLDLVKSLVKNMIQRIPPPDGPQARIVARHRTSRGTRGGTALLVCLFVVALTSVLVLGVVDVKTTQFAALRNVRHYDQAYYVAAAGVHHALAELEADATWRTGLSSITFPPGSSSTYTVTVADLGDATILITATGTATGVVRKLEVNVDPAS